MTHATLKGHATLKKIFAQKDMINSVPENSTVGEVLDQAIGRFKEDLEKRYGLQGAQEMLKIFILLLNGVYLSKPDNLGTKVKESDQIEIREPISGG